MRIGQFTDTFLQVVDGVGRVVSSYAHAMGQLCDAVRRYFTKEGA